MSDWKRAGLSDPQAAIPARLVAAVPDRPESFETFAAFINRIAFAVVFTAHPTFGMPRAVAALLAQAASLPDEAARAGLIERAAALSTRPDAPITLDVEFEQACAAANNGRLALDAFNGALLDAARARWPERWTELTPRPFAIASWVGCDTGRADRYRLVGHPALPADLEADAVRPGDARTARASRPAARSGPWPRVRSRR